MSVHVAEEFTKDDHQQIDAARIRDLVQRFEIDYDADFDFRHYVAPGPVSKSFILDTGNSTTAIMGPVGSGKTTACAFKRMMLATLAPIAWHPEDDEPTRMCKWIVLRDSFRSAEKSVLESWKQWFPKTMPGAKWAGGNDRPVTHVQRMRGADGIRIEAITEFSGLNDNDISAMLKSREYSGAWLNEYDTHAPGSLDDVEGRVGRYPSDSILLSVADLEKLERHLGRKLHSGRRFASVICDFNAPTTDNHAYRDFVTNIANTPDRAFYRQPGGLEPEAENRDRLEAGYYERIAANNDPSVVMRLVHNRFGYSRHGKPVYEGFDRPRHVALQKIPFRPELDLIAGIDLSMNTLNPAAVFLQVASGRICVIGELPCDHGTGAARFGEMLAQAYAEHFKGARKILQYADPAAAYGADREGGQLTAMETIAKATGLPVMVPANGSNELGMRLDAVKTELRGYLDANTHLLVCPSGCPELIAGFEGKYRFKKKPRTASHEFEEVPDKTHPHSDLHDALQYGILGIRGRAGAVRGATEGRDPSQVRTERNGSRKAASGFDVHRVGLK